MAEGSGGGGANPPKFNRKSFEYKMCKKVAELTQVVHMLFVKNHEREVEIEALKAAYEDEISNVIADARSQLEKLRLAVAEEQRKGEGLRRGFEQTLDEREKETAQKLAASGVRVEELERDREFMREQVARLQRIVDDSQPNNHADDDELKQFKDQLDLSQAELRRKTAELDRFREMMGKQTDQQREKDSIVSRLTSEMEQVQSDLGLQIEDLKNQLLETSNGKERLQQKNKNLEMDVRSLKTELENRRQSDFMVQQPVVTSPENVDTNEELERLRREVRMYRMELSNREGNFNRMFTDSSPIRLDHRAGGMSSGMSSGMAGVRTRIETMQPGRPQMVGNRTPRDVNSNPQPQYRPGLNRLPTLSMDNRQRATNSRSGRNNRLIATPRERQTAGYPMPGFH